jgi:hypothetical protein
MKDLLLTRHNTFAPAGLFYEQIKNNNLRSEIRMGTRLDLNRKLSVFYAIGAATRGQTSAAFPVFNIRRILK